ncbi:DNA-methyltransferase [Maricurvus nonylphenolicus]|uniref:DNA-methyltransferase n=1 Tax=Maricurvus nonylphenolicus TaxID=1008307 RepID=UPI0036F3F4B6
MRWGILLIDLTGFPMRLLHGDCLELLPTLPDNSIDLILTDPPYYRVKSNDWDNQWDSEVDFMQWCERVLIEFSRVLKPTGSLYWFAGPYMAAKLELLIGQHYQVLNHIVWVKRAGRHNGCRKEGLRKYFPQTERVIFAEPKQAGKALNSQINAQAKYLFKPLADYMNNLRKSAGLTISECESICGSTTAGHYFSASQFHLPSQQNFTKLLEAFGNSEKYSDLEGRYRDIQSEFLNLKAKYEHLRRPFAVTKDVPFTDVWHFEPVAFYEGKHQCEKPMALLEHMVTVSSRPGDRVLDAFMGSGSTGDAAIRLKRDFVGIEADADNFEMAEARIMKSRKGRELQSETPGQACSAAQSEVHECLAL